MAPWRIALLNTGFPDAAVEMRIAAESGCQLGVWSCQTPEEVAAVAADADAVVVTLWKLNRAMLDVLPRCRVIGRLGVGLDNIDLEAASERGIAVINVPDYCTEEVAVHTCSMVLALSRKLLMGDRLVRAGQWREWAQLKPMHPPSEQTLGLVGAGRIGAEVVRRLAPFGYRVMAYDPYTDAESLPEGVQRASFDQLLAESDVISIHCPLTPETHHLFNRNTFARMRPGAALVNVSRGPIVHEADLLDAVRSGHLSGAALDVMEEEPPPPNHPLFELPQVILTSHLAWYSETSMVRLRELGLRRVLDYLAGRPVPTVVNAAALGRAGGAQV